MEKIKGQLESYKEQPFSLVLRFLMWIATFLTVGITVCIVGYILIRGIPNLSPEMFAWEYNTENVSMMPAIDRKSTRLNSSHTRPSRMPSSA